MRDVEKLFDIFCKDNQRRRELEKKYRLRMTRDDYLFYEDQKGPRKARCLRLEEPLTSSDLRFRERMNKKSGVQLSSPSHSGSVDASDAGNPVVLNDQSLFSDSDSICSQSSESCSVNCFGASQPNLQNRMNFPNLAQITETYQISDRAAAALANAVLTDVEIITKNKKTYIIDKSKLRRERQKYRKQIRQDQAMFYEQVNGVYVDGRKDATLTTTYLESGKIHQSTCLEEHIVIIGEPGEYYLSHFSTEDGKGSSIADGIFSVIKGTDLEINLAVIGTDGAATMTGINKGCIRKLEEALQRPLQWVICLLHTNELSLRHIFVEIGWKYEKSRCFCRTNRQEIGWQCLAMASCCLQAHSQSTFSKFTRSCS